MYKIALKIHVFGPQHLQLARAQSGESEHSKLNAPDWTERLQQAVHLVQCGRHHRYEGRLVHLAKAQGVRGLDGTPYMRHFGLDGHGGASLDQTGGPFNLTRERIRQICLRARRILERGPKRTPLLKRTLAYVCKRIPATADVVEQELQAIGLTKGQFRLEGLQNLLSIINRRCPFAILMVGENRLVMVPGHARLTGRIVAFASKMIRRFGVITVADIFAQLQSKGLRSANEETVQSILCACPNFEWLDQASGWFWLRSKKKIGL